MANLTKKQKQLLDYIEGFIEETGYSPTYREIMSGLGYKSVATVAKHIDNLVVLGLLRKSNSGEARSVSLNKNNYSSEHLNIAIEILRQKSADFQRSGKAREAEILEFAINIVNTIQK